ncbi:MAG TPA: universal stress protein [Candidatus Sulfobium mesophilum]|uniref:UspA domain-containing protein n=1 Tax=Candidatus Sulfobium mesophilum TaxID=2016548 RepID=A0A2U3QKJ6_9BACT|nr:UspA domain-containing protein [Candidatus Sulfobium mesophilum]HSB30028.1 universal stress protein [Candidatus Sulfobium mesophilum]
MGKYKKILVAFDGSVSGTNALLQSFRLATEEKSWITVATVVPAYEGDLNLIAVGDIHQALRRPGEEILSRANALAKKEGALIKTVLEEGEAYDRLVDLAEGENCGVIVMGRRGSSSTERSHIGSVTARVIGHSQRDVFVVPEGTNIGWKKILIATDGSRYSSFATDRAIDFAKSYGGSLTAVSIVDVPSEFYAEAPAAVDKLIESAKGFVAAAKEKAEANDVMASGFVGEGEAFEIITKLAQKEGIDVIIMGSHGKTGLKRLLMGSVAEKVIGHAPCPVLVVKG